MKKKFIVHLSPRKFFLKDIQWFKKKIIPLVTKLRKYLVLSLSTFIQRKSIKKELGK
jgi:hypothetical protein